MVIRTKRNGEQALVTVDLFVAMSLLVIALIPISFSFLQEQKLCRAYYQRAVISQIMDGEMEALVAGEWKAFGEGEQEYPFSSAVTKNLPDGKLFFTRSGKNLRMEWRPGNTTGRGGIIREALGQ